MKNPPQSGVRGILHVEWVWADPAGPQAARAGFRYVTKLTSMASSMK